MKKFKSILNYLLFDQPTSQSLNSALIDVFTTSVCSAIVEAMKAFTPKFKVSTRAISGFDEACNLTRTRANQARRTFQDELAAQRNTEQALQT
jgi:hypothetical protein